jgi:dTDP-glucose 4,6-dehydratase
VARRLADDLDFVLDRTRPLWEGLRGGRLFLTGGTGFVGCWLLESFTWAVERLGLGAEAVVLTRDPDAFRAKAPHLAGHPAVRLHRGGVTDFAFPAGRFTHAIHAAGDTAAGPTAADAGRLAETIIDGTRRVLACAREAGAANVLFVSSGAVYGRQPPDLAHVPEDHPGAPDPTHPRSAYGEGKRAAELFCALEAARSGRAVTLARCFTLVGPYLPLGARLAVGNFLRDGLAGGPIRVAGDGTPVRSYLYAADLAVWLWTILFRGVGGRAYNVGSEEAVTIAGAAAAVAGCFDPRPAVVVAEAPAGRPVERYVPSVRRAAAELGLEATVPLSEALRRTARWLAARA